MVRGERTLVRAWREMAGGSYSSVVNSSKEIFDGAIGPAEIFESRASKAQDPWLGPLFGQRTEPKPTELVEDKQACGQGYEEDRVCNSWGIRSYYNERSLTLPIWEPNSHWSHHGLVCLRIGPNRLVEDSSLA
ncbi:unnamed protein product [Dovyalis caffra]|uniref:Uncharacterized protein n=1 Tax=Dovyalis caffra TaxID=77055 RepID=A0AAV1ST67_9ROSI|nr:unnamed protein product [Dovyalis caffra]